MSRLSARRLSQQQARESIEEKCRFASERIYPLVAARMGMGKGQSPPEVRAVTKREMRVAALSDIARWGKIRRGIKNDVLLGIFAVSVGLDTCACRYYEPDDAILADFSYVASRIKSNRPNSETVLSSDMGHETCHAIFMRNSEKGRHLVENTMEYLIFSSRSLFTIKGMFDFAMNAPLDTGQKNRMLGAMRLVLSILEAPAYFMQDEILKICLGPSSGIVLDNHPQADFIRPGFDLLQKLKEKTGDSALRIFMENLPRRRDLKNPDKYIKRVLG